MEGARSSSKMVRDKYRTEAPVVTFVPLVEEDDDVPSSSSPSRVGGRDSREFRPLFMKAGVIPQASGSAYIEAHHTKVVCAVYGPRPAPSSAEYRDKGKLTCSFKFASFSSPLLSRHEHRPSTKEQELGDLLVQALEVSVRLEAFPKSLVEVFILVLQDDGSAFSTAINCATLALADAGVEMFDLVTSCTMARISDRNVLDPDAREEGAQRASLTVALMPSLNEISQFIQHGQLDRAQITQAMELCLDGCSQLHSVLSKSILSSSTTTHGEDPLPTSTPS